MRTATQKFSLVWTKIRLRITWRSLGFAVLIIVLALLAWAAYLRFAWGYNWAEWTGLRERTFTDWVGLADFTPPSENFQRGKTFWDWLQLLIIPVVLAVVAFWFNRQERRNEIRIASDRTREVELQGYLDKLTELILQNNLKRVSKNSNVRTIARARTLTTLRLLDGRRKGILIRFLYEAGLIVEGKAIISLMKADLRGIILRGDDIRQVDFRWADMDGANLKQSIILYSDLSHSHLREANLYNARLEYNDLGGANLQRANLRRAYLPGTRFFMAYLKGADMRESVCEGANMGNANLSEADLSSAICINADFCKANFTGAKMKGADFRGANFEEATVTAEQLSQAFSLKGATMPDGTIHE